ncbi:MAG: DUF362 domain-containing protein [Bacteroidales bacterium]|nr:DUF362 domain-containing protein [Bacteroidales bacterium]
MKHIIFILAACCMMMAGCKPKSEPVQAQESQEGAAVYLTREISPEALVRIYKALGVEAKGRVAVKISTGEGSNPNYLKPELIRLLVEAVNGTIVECNTAYGNAHEDKQDERNTSANHWKVIERHGFTPLFKVDIMDEEGEMRIPVTDTTHLKYDIVGSHMANYDFMIALNHFKGHPMGGYGGALKNLSIGCASSNGKAYIHSAGKMEVLDMANLWTPEYIGDQDGFLESMAAAAQGVVNYFQKKQGIIYISVMNNMSIDCDCVDHPEPVKLKDYGILASTDPVALDQACVDIINQQKVTAENDPTDLIGRINKQHGVHTIEWAEKIGLGSRKYHMVDIDRK